MLVLRAKQAGGGYTVVSMVDRKERRQGLASKTSVTSSVNRDPIRATALVERYFLFT